MKKNLHPQSYQKITITLLNGKKFETRSTYSTDSGEIKCEIDIFKHPAWLKEDDNFANANSINVNVKKFQSKFGSNLIIDSSENSVSE